VGHEIQKTRPALIVQNDVANRFSPITIVAAITSKFNEPPYSTDVILESDQSGLSLRSSVLLNQIRSVDRRRLGKHLGRANAATMRAVDQALQISLGLTLQ
jgi:mRNA interferase MazF